MCPVEASPEYDLAVVPHRPRSIWLILIGALLRILLLVALVIGSYYFGVYRVTAEAQKALAERDELQMSYTKAQEKIKQLEQEVANVTLGSQVDRKATEHVRAQVVELKNRIAELERDNIFYRDLMRPENDDKGLSVEDPVIEVSDQGESVYGYKVVVKQQAANRSQVGGYAEFVLVGKDASGKPQRLSLHELSESHDTQRIKLNFRYFQRIEGQIVLPEGFVPDSIELKIVAVKPSKVLIEKTFNWITKES